MSHTITIRLIADQVIWFRESQINIHDIEAIILSGQGEVEEVILKTISK